MMIIIKASHVGVIVSAADLYQYRTWLNLTTFVFEWKLFTWTINQQINQP